MHVLKQAATQDLHNTFICTAQATCWLPKPSVVVFVGIHFSCCKDCSWVGPGALGLLLLWLACQIVIYLFLQGSILGVKCLSIFVNSRLEPQWHHAGITEPTFLAFAAGRSILMYAVPLLALLPRQVT
jgi:hypothetical protein